MERTKDMQASAADQVAALIAQVRALAAQNDVTCIVFSNTHARGIILWNALIDEDEACDAAVSFREKSFP